MKIRRHAVLTGVGKDAPIQGLWRVVWIYEPDDIYLIEIPTRAKEDASPEYHRAPTRQPLPTYQAWLDADEIAVTQLIADPIALMSDEEIRKRYPPRKTDTGDVPSECAALRVRDQQWGWVKDICDYIDDSPAEAFELRGYAVKVRERALELGVRVASIYDSVHRVMAYAVDENSLLPAYTRCGGAGKEREPKTSVRLGRKSKAFKDGEISSPGIHLSPMQKRWIAIGYDKFLREGCSVEEAYLNTCALWWSSGTKIVDGQKEAVLLPAEQRPSRAQFRYWGVRGEDGEAAFKLLLKHKEWEQKFRAMLGSAFSGVRGVGQMGVMDATGTHQNLVSMTNRLNAIGPAHRIMVHDGLSEVITGFYCGLEAPSERTANLAKVMSAMDKVEIFARFGITITSDQVPACYYRKFRVDNGEARTKGFLANTTASGSGVELVESNRPERKQQVEGGHKVLHGLLDNKLDGATYGRPRERGEEHSAVRACWTWFEYMGELLRAIVYFNCVADATSVFDRHPYRAAMLRDGVRPRRADIFKWCVENNHIGSPAYDVMKVQADLLPRYKAVVKQMGIYLLRPDRGDKPELVVGLRFTGARASSLGWHDGKRKDFHISVRLDPSSPNICWFSDEMGLHQFNNVHPDRLTAREANLDDYLAMQDRQLIDKTVDQSRSDQEKLDFNTHRDSMNEQLRTAKQAAIKATPGGVSKKGLRSGIDLNRAQEAKAIAEAVDPITRAPKVKRTPAAAPAPAAAPSSSAAAEAADAQKNADGAGACAVPTPPSVRPPSSPPEPPPEPQAGTVIDALAAFRAQRRRA